MWYKIEKNNLWITGIGYVYQQGKCVFVPASVVIGAMAIDSVVNRIISWRR